MGVKVLDAGVLIGFLDDTDPFHEAALEIIAGRTESDELALPLVAYAEVSVGIVRAGAAVSFFDTVLRRLVIEVLPATREVGALAAQMRADPSFGTGQRWRLPDALVAATAVLHNAEQIVTTDAHWPDLQEQDPAVIVLKPTVTSG